MVVQSSVDPDSATISKGTTEKWHVLDTENATTHVFRVQIAGR